MIRLACGIHEARRRIRCPVCPRIARELADEPAAVRVFIVGSSSETAAPAGQGKKGKKR